MVIELAKPLVSAGRIGQILTLVERINHLENEFLDGSTVIESGIIDEVTLRSIIKNGKEYNWIIEDGDKLSNGDETRELLDGGRLEAKRKMLLQMISSSKPKWIRLLRKGPTNSFLRKLSSNEKQLFREYNLLPIEGLLSDQGAEKWWFEAQKLGWDVENEIRAEHGKIGEELSMLWEEERTELRPVWISRIDSEAGYDIQSIESADERQERLIEVKATTSGFVYVTRNEARVCSENNESYCFHIWKLNMDNYGRSLLCTISAEEMMRHFPQNQGTGVWQDVEIPINSFESDRFGCPFNG